MIVRFKDVSQFIINIEQIAFMGGQNEGKEVNVTFIFNSGHRATTHISQEEWEFAITYLPTEVFYKAR